MPSPAVMSRSAVLSDDGLYRYELTRAWEPFGSRMVFVMLNPSTADAVVDDPTIRRCMGFARREGYRGIKVVNLFGLRVTRPVHLFDGTIANDPNGLANAIAVEGAIDRARDAGAPVVLAWGALPRRRCHESEAYGVISSLYASKPFDSLPFRCLGKTADGSPRHPLYVRADQPLEIWP
ncbi:MAG: hypothetical protein JWO62_2608 [Acidimicrobiaceae bacterium]|nr:hypothetical protein [Acidimicrobiaceae bacterium]